MHNLANLQSRDAILRRLQTVRADSPGLWGKMSSHQMICHLNDSFLSMMGQRPISTLRPAPFIKWAALYLPLPWPKGIKTRPEVDQFVGGSKPSEFASDVQGLTEQLKIFSAPEPSFIFPPHPIFGPLSPWQWMRWGYLHCDHHLRQFGH